MSNITCLIPIVTILFTIYRTTIYTSFNFSSEISCMNLWNNWKCSLISLLLLIGQLLVFATPSINLSLPFSRSSHWNSKWSTVCPAFPHGHVGVLRLVVGNCLEDPGLYERKILRLIFRKWQGGSWSGLIWFRIETCSGHLWMR
jgi:hypothetical protein